MSELARDKFFNRIFKGMHGPGSDTWGLPDEEEIISYDYPLQRYFTGILFPERDNLPSEDEADNAELASQTPIEEPEQDIYFKQIEEIGLDTDHKKTESSVISKTNFFPTNIAMTSCIPPDLDKIDTVFSFGLYYRPKLSEIKIKISPEGYNSFFDDELPSKFPFINLLKYEDGYMFLSRELKGHSGGRYPRSGEYLDFDSFKKSQDVCQATCKRYIPYLEKLTDRSRIWKRKDYNIKCRVDIRSTRTPIPINIPDSPYRHISIAYNVKVISNESKKFVKIQLANTSKKHPAKKYSNKNDQLNQKCLFQSKISVMCDNFLEYKDENFTKYMLHKDNEVRELDFLYRGIKRYAIGHNCSIFWNDQYTKIETTFTPTADIKGIINHSTDNDISAYLDIRKYTLWGDKPSLIISNLSKFLDKYAEWIKDQQLRAKKESSQDYEVCNGIINHQKENLERMRNNINLLKDEEVLQAFLIANTALYIQLIISNDHDFSGHEKELTEISDMDLDDIVFFRDYHNHAKERIGFIPSFRPFQLAFIILSIDGIIDPHSKYRKDIVDLIWFPTGGGKTEAYLTLAAFTIAYRRLKNETGYQGTSVIMRYTLRLLTTQQFERASRIICALEFLRKQPDLKKILKDEPITIGLWVGMSTTPNTLKEAEKQIKAIEEEAEKKDKGELSGHPDDKNTFQITACPWCGTKLVTKKRTPGDIERWVYGFDKKRKDFKIYCCNSKCPFKKRIPVQVVDEALYTNPPTLLFGTIDKFAMLAWQENANRIFGSLDDSRSAPDLIIQDELHLISGPLGSIAGLFESVIELLSTKNNMNPKIIASTATTRNTSDQVFNLYGNRKVNIFPPSGIDPKDGFFMKEDPHRERRYTGLMPTGKTYIDTQIQILAHLIFARLETYLDNRSTDEINDYWTIVSYFNSLKDLGRIYNKIGDEISSSSSSLQNRLISLYNADFDENRFNISYLSSRTRELTSRIESTKIKHYLSEIEKTFDHNKIKMSKKGSSYITDIVDLILATNMISVGIDISRLNVLLINGMPRNVAEYIQASSRIGRKNKGIVISLLDPNKAREKSYFENFNIFHKTFYKHIEPLSLTPFTEETIEKMASSILISYLRNKYQNMSADKEILNFEKSMIDPLLEFIKNRFSNKAPELNLFIKKIDALTKDLKFKIEDNSISTYKTLLVRPSEKQEYNKEWLTMQSMREIDSSTFIQIKEDF